MDEQDQKDLAASIAAAVAPEVARTLNGTVSSLTAAVTSLHTKVATVETKMVGLEERFADLKRLRCPAHEHIVARVTKNASDVQANSKRLDEERASQKYSFSRATSLISLGITVVLFIITIATLVSVSKINEHEMVKAKQEAKQSGTP